MGVLKSQIRIKILFLANIQEINVNWQLSVLMEAFAHGIMLFGLGLNSFWK